MESIKNGFNKLFVKLNIKEEKKVIEVPGFKNAALAPLDQIYKEMDSSPGEGISQQRAEEFQEKYGLNEIPKEGISKLKIYLAPIFNVLILILLVSAVIMFFLGENSSAIISLSIVIINAVTAIVQQFRAQKTLESLQKISALKAQVVRNGEQKEISSLEVIPGDILILKQGDKIAADARIIEAVDLAVGEAPLTGESMPVEKTAEALSLSNKDTINGVPIQHQTNMLFMGTYIQEGRARAIVTGTGINTEIGKISQNLAQTGMAEIPLTKKMNNFAKILAIVVILLLFVVFIYTIFTSPPPIDAELIRQKFKFALSIGMNIIPTNLPLLTTIILITGVFNLATAGVIIRNLSAVESLGRVSIICSDKTGTITQNQMTVQKIWYDNKIYEVTGAGYDKNGKILDNGQEINLKNKPYFELLLLSVVINNNSSIEEEEVKVKLKDQDIKMVRKALGAPTEAALVVLAEKGGIDHSTLKARYKFIQELPFNSAVKRMSTIVEGKAGERIAFVKGASEIILNLSEKIVLNGIEENLTDKKREELAGLIEQYANKGYRTLSMAFKKITDNKTKYDRDEIESNLVFHGFVMILDPPRDGVKEAVNSCETAGITVVMITGDHPSTAKSIAEQMDIFGEGEIVVEGKDIENLNPTDFMRTAVFARVSPSDKEVIVKRYQDEQRRHVAMTGDGINDSLALKLSNTGIAMGITGTDVAKEAADMVISDDNFTSIEKGIRVGRGIFSRIRSLIYFYICMDLCEGIFFFTLAFIPGFELLSFIQHMWIVLAVHSLPPLALTFDSAPKDIMKEPPRNDEEIFNKDMLKMLIFHTLILLFGVLMGYILCLTPILGPNAVNLNQIPAFPSFIDTTIPAWHQKAATVTVTILFISEPIMILNIRRPNTPVWISMREENNQFINFFISLTILAQIGLVLGGWLVIPAFQSVGIDFNQCALSLTDWLWVLLLSFQSFIIIEIYKWRARKKKVFF
ncbi:MAG: cation-transporting P-type ATPase [Candidatus Lokiarchaeota archaeon]|nr:cation-transporting P-type ATPase [Candidatus Lokiarchaeota archaeon]